MVQRIPDAELPAAAATLARAFRDNPAWIGILKGDDADKRERTLRAVTLGFAQTVQREGVVEVVKDGDTIVAVSLLFPPGRYPPSAIGQLITAWAVIRARLGLVHRFIAADSALQRMHMHEPHWFLWMIGVEPERQGRGLGSQLLRSLNEKADAERMPCYLETDRKENLHLYQNHGFRVTSDKVLRGVDTQMWFMARDAIGKPPAA